MDAKLLDILTNLHFDSIGYKSTGTLYLEPGHSPCESNRHVLFDNVLGVLGSHPFPGTIRSVDDTTRCPYSRPQSVGPTKRGTLFKVARWRGLPSRACKPATSLVIHGEVLTIWSIRDQNAKTHAILREIAQYSRDIARYLGSDRS